MYVENSAIFVPLNPTATLTSGYIFRDILLKNFVRLIVCVCVCEIISVGVCVSVYVCAWVCNSLCVCLSVCGCKTEGLWKAYFKQTALEAPRYKNMQWEILKISEPNSTSLRYGCS
jgi:hypothetical protein